MGKRIIYKKKYPRLNLTELFTQAHYADESEPPIPASDEFFNKIVENTACILIPERIQHSKLFIHTAI